MTDPKRVPREQLEHLSDGEFAGLTHELMHRVAATALAALDERDRLKALLRRCKHPLWDAIRREESIRFTTTRETHGSAWRRLSEEIETALSSPPRRTTMPDLVWTKTAPTVAGWYWVRGDSPDHWESMYEVAMRHDGTCLYKHGDRWSPLLFPGIYVSGPIEQPSEPEVKP